MNVIFLLAWSVILVTSIWNRKVDQIAAFSAVVISIMHFAMLI